MRCSSYDVVSLLSRYSDRKGSVHIVVESKNRPFLAISLFDGIFFNIPEMVL